MEDAARLIDAVGFCLLFASTQKIELPSLFEAVKGRRDVHIDDWDADAERVWGWKNDLPATRRAYYGKPFTGKPMFLSLAILPHTLALAPANVNVEYRRGRMSYAAKRVHDALDALGPTPTLALREAAGLDHRAYHHALDELQSARVIAPVGATIERGAWASQIFELVARWFPHESVRARQIDAATARRTLVQQYVTTVLACDEPMLARVFGWSREQTHQTVADLLARRILSKQGVWIVRYVE